MTGWLFFPLTPSVYFFFACFFCFRGGLVGFVAVGGTCLLSTIVRHVPARAFELNRRRGDYRFNFAAAVGAFFQVRAGDVFNFLRVAAALQAFVLVQGHCCSSQVVLKTKSIALLPRASASS